MAQRQTFARILLAALFPIPCFAASSASPPCELRGGGCLKELSPSHLQATFGGTVSTVTASRWEHVYRDGHAVLFTLKSEEVCLASCRPDPGGSCKPPGVASRAELVGVGTFTTATDTAAAPCNFDVEIFDADPCPGDKRDTYSITVRRGLVTGEGDIVHSISGVLGCGNLTIDAPWAHGRDAR
jgi:hypothetical protein